MTDSHSTLDDEVDDEPIGDSRETCFFWESAKGGCHFEPLIVGSEPCADCPEGGPVNHPMTAGQRDRTCGHCGRGNARASAYGVPLCHPDDPELPDCYRRVTIYREPVGALLGAGPKPRGVERITS